ncbi:MAG: hypothetical protein A3H98_03820 [Bacteroidetes bacterium RIFCSPLOWO2_02_FULL_36_8]|nr:MAG: hypothetical protein A3H98_03820 [Bacteroidetes bacterium RIFCSPLOWO2_02_FULL_36_8]OFY68798.1 MAG: hypothetical protein A3G23_03130 [Bacteroidetes bacterium RIFCSPLOWO2_12_FULL_37_12]
MIKLKYLYTMETTILLKEKWRVQKELAESAGYNLTKYTVLVDSIVKYVRQKYKKKNKTGFQ